MSKRKVDLAVGEYYHVFNRGVDHRDIFLDDEDFDRFLIGVQCFNATETIGSLYYFLPQKEALVREYGPPKPLVRIIAYCCNPNHFHFILEQVEERGIERFMHRIGMGYAKYFNKKHQRSGTLYQGPFKSVHIDSDSYLQHLSVYVNLNDRVHQLPRGVSRTSWEEYISETKKKSNVEMCHKKVVMGQFRSPGEYREFAEANVKLIQKRKELQRFFL